MVVSQSLMLMVKMLWSRHRTSIMMLVTTLPYSQQLSTPPQPSSHSPTALRQVYRKTVEENRRVMTVEEREYASP